MHAALVIYLLPALLLLTPVSRAAITNLPNTVDYPENTAGTVFTVYADTAATALWTIAGATCTASTSGTVGICDVGSTSCVVEFAAGAEGDFETDQTQTCSITFTDGTADTQDLTINIIDQDDVAPDVTCDVATLAVDENDDSTAGQLISTCSNSFPPLTFTVYFQMTVTPASGASKFTIDSATGEVSWAAAPLNLDYETAPEYTLSIESFTGAQTSAAAAEIAVTVVNVNEAPVITNLPQRIYIDEDFPRYTNPGAPSAVDLLTLVVSDEDNNDPDPAGTGGVNQAFDATVVAVSCGETTYFTVQASSADADGNNLLIQTDPAVAIFDYESTCNVIEISIQVTDRTLQSTDTPPGIETVNGVGTTAYLGEGETSAIAILTLEVLDVEEVPWFNELGAGLTPVTVITDANEDLLEYPKNNPVNGARFRFSENRGIPSKFENVAGSDNVNNVDHQTDGVFIADLSDWTQGRQYYDPDCSPAVLGTVCTATFQFINTDFMTPFFEIREDGSTNNYYLYQVNDIDYETLCALHSFGGNTYNFDLTVVGVDDTGLQTTNSLSIHLQLRDHNEYIPLMNDSYHFQVEENAPFSTAVGWEMICVNQFECHADDPMEFYIADQTSDGYYYFEFVSTTTGDLTVLRPPDYELVHQVIFEVDCVDDNTGGTGGTLTATSTVTVDIIDLNDNEPEFTQTFFSVATRYDTEHRTFLVQLNSTDDDSGVNAVPIYALGVFSEHFEIDSSSGDVFTKGVELIPFETYVIYGVVYDTADSVANRNIGKNIATIRVDTFVAEYVLVDLYLGIDDTEFDPGSFEAALDEVLAPFVFTVYQHVGGVSREDIVSDGVKVSVYARRDGSTLLEENLGERAVFVSADELLQSMREYVDGTPSELFQSPDIDHFNVLSVQETHVAEQIPHTDPEDRSWMVETPEGNVVLGLLCLLVILVLLGIVLVFYLLLKDAECWRKPASGKKNVRLPPAKDPDSKLIVGEQNKKSITALTRQSKSVPAAAPPTRSAAPPPPPDKASMVPVVSVAPKPANDVRVNTNSGKKIWEIRKSQENTSPLTNRL